MSVTPIEALQATCAANFLTIKDKVPTGTLVNIVGTVTAVSEIFRVKRDLLFLIAVENIIKIVVKQSQYLVWQGDITPNVDFVFTNLRATTLLKGSVCPCLVFVPWNKSSVHPASETPHTLLTFQDWLKSRSIDITDTGLGHSPINTTKSAKFVSYKGVITDVSNAHLGVYQLDNRVGLYVCSVAAENKFSFLTLGSKIVIHNAHRAGFAAAPKIRLFGCMSTCIRVEESPAAPSKQPAAILTYLCQLMSAYSFTAREIAELVELPQTLALKLSECFSSISSIQRMLPLLFSRSCCHGLRDHTRNLLQEFLAEPHDCCIAKITKSRFPQIPLLRAVKELLEEKSCDLSDLREKYYGSTLPVSELKEMLYWSYVTTEEDGQGKLLIGCLCCNPATGRLQLHDSSGAVDIALCLSQTDLSHVCSHECISPRPGCVFPCSTMQPAFIDCVVCVRKYKCVAERFLNIDIPNSYHIDSKYVHKSRYVQYLVFSLTDCVLLHNPNKEVLPQQTCHTIDSHNTDLHKRKYKRRKVTDAFVSKVPESSSMGTNNSCDPDLIIVNTGEPKEALAKRNDMKMSETKSQLVYVSHKESLMTVSRSASPHLRFCVLGYLIKPPVPDPSIHVTSCKMKTIDTNTIPTCENNSGLSKKGNSFGEYHKHVLPSSKLASEDVGKASDDVKASDGRANPLVFREHDSDGRGLRPSTCPESAEPVVLLFQNNVKWFPVIQTDAFYRLTLCSSDALRCELAGDKLQKAVKSSHTRRCIEVPDKLDLKRVFSGTEISEIDHMDTTLSSKPEYTDIADLLLDSCVLSQVNIRGRVKSRTHRTQDLPAVGRNSRPNNRLHVANQSLGVSTLDNQCVCLCVSGLESPGNEVTVYMNLQVTSYPQGLLPGTGVILHRLERKVSRIDRVYCQFTTVSTITVFQPDETQHRASSESTEPTTETSPAPSALPPQYIVDLWRQPDAAQQFTAEVFICHILRLCLKSVCSGCGSVVSSVGCASPACTGSESTLQAKVSVLIDDGTSPAVAMFANQPGLTRKLLCLSGDEWRHLESATQSVGEVYMQQFVGEGQSPLENFLIRLSTSPVVKRQCLMSLRHRTVNQNHQNTWKNGELNMNRMSSDDFPYHSVKAVAMFETRCLPYVQLDCVDLVDL